MAYDSMMLFKRFCENENIIHEYHHNPFINDSLEQVIVKTEVYNWGYVSLAVTKERSE